MIERQKLIYLANPALEIINVLNGVKTETADYHPRVKDYDELTFEVDKYINVDGEMVLSNCYDMLDVYMYLYLDGIGFFQMQMPTVSNDGFHETKQIVAYSIEKEFEDKDWKGLEINTGLEGSLEQLAEDNVDELGFAREFVTLYRPDKQDLSFLHLLIREKMPMWSVLDEDIDTLAWNKKMSISEDNINCYALLTSVLGPKLDVIFMFDTMHRRIKVIAKESLNNAKYDTNIYIGLRNLMNSEDFSIDEDSVFTRFSVKGDDTLDIRDYNYGDDRIVNLDYFMNNKYMSNELIQKLRDWLYWRDYNRQDYLTFSKQLVDLNDKIREIYYRVPADELKTNQYTDMDDELLLKNLEYFNTQITALQISVDPDVSPKTKVEDYVPRKKPNGSVDHDWYLERLWEKANGYGGYYTYYEIITFIIPNINIAIRNKGKTKEEKEDYNEDFEQMWELFGIYELEAKRDNYKNQMESVESYAKSWNELTSQEKLSWVGGEGQYNIKHNEYAKLAGWLGNENTPDTLLHQLKILQEEADELQAQYDNIDEVYRQPLREMASIESEFWGLTTKELYTVYTLFHDTDYQNQNIITTSVDTALTKLDREVVLYDDAIDKLSEVAQPQMHYNVSMDNFLQIPEFSIWKDDLQLLNFIRVGIYDNYAIKLRVIGYHYNPCEIDPTLELEFSNYITSKSGRSDLTDIVGNENNRGSKNSISIGTGNSDTDREYITALLQKMTQMQLFNNSVSEIASGTTAQFDEGRVMNIVSDMINASQIHVDHLTGDTAEFSRLLADYIDADYIVTELLKADEATIGNILRVGTDTITEITGDYISTTTINAAQIVGTDGDFQNLTTKVLTVGENAITTIAEGVISTAEISAGQITSGTIDTDRLNVSEIITVGESGITQITERAISTAEISADQITTGTLGADRITSNTIVTKLINATTADFQDMTADTAFIEYLNSGIIEAGSIQADQIIAGLVDVENPEDFSLLADSAFIQYLNSELITASEIRVDDLKAKLATITVADIDEMHVEHGFVESLQSFTNSTIEQKAETGYFYNLIAGNISVADLATHTATADEIVLISQDGNPSIAFKGSTQQFYDSDGNIRVQIGQDGNGDFNFVVTSADGQTALFDYNGITRDGIPANTIVNNMINDGTIQKSKLGFPIIDTNPDGTINITQIKDGSGGNFGVEYTTFQQTVSQSMSDLSDAIEDSATYTLYIDAPYGTNIRGGNVTLTARLFKNSTEVTDDWDGSYFHWTRRSQDTDGDTYWNEAHTTGAKTIIITANEVTISADFQCEFSANGITVSS